MFTDVNDRLMFTFLEPLETRVDNRDRIVWRLDHLSVAISTVSDRNYVCKQTTITRSLM